MYLKNYMNIFLNIKAEDAHRLRQFLKKNPSTKGDGLAREHLDAGIISRVVYQLEHALNELWVGKPDDLCKADLKAIPQLQQNVVKAGRLCEEPIYLPTTQPIYIWPLYQEQSFLDIGLCAIYDCTYSTLYVWQ